MPSKPSPARLDLLHRERTARCAAEGSLGIEWCWEIRGPLWHPWTLEINGRFSSFSLNDIGLEDLNALCAQGRLTLVESVPPVHGPMGDKFDHRRHRLVVTNKQAD